MVPYTPTGHNQGDGCKCRACYPLGYCPWCKADIQGTTPERPHVCTGKPK